MVHVLRVRFARDEITNSLHSLSIIIIIINIIIIRTSLDSTAIDALLIVFILFYCLNC